MRACPTPGRRGLSSGLMEHWEVETSLVAIGEVNEEGGSIPDSLVKVLPRSVPGSAPFWGVNLSLDGNYAAKTGEGTRGVLATCG